VVLTRDGRKFGGADAVIHLAEHVAWAKPLCWLAHVPAFRAMLRASYRWGARHRHCSQGACGIPGESRWPAWAPLALFPALTALLLRHLPAWIFMWAMATALFAGGKWLTWWPVRRQWKCQGIGNALGYLLLWVGMDVRPFLSRGTFAPKPRPQLWGF